MGQHDHDLSRREMLGITLGLGGLALTKGGGSAFAEEARRVSKIVTIDAKPEPIDIDLARTAVIVVDMQNDFGAEGGMFHRAGVDISKIQAAVGPTKKVVTAAVLLADCTAEPVGSDFPRSNHEASLYIIERSFGWISNSGAFVKGLA